VVGLLVLNIIEDFSFELSYFMSREIIWNYSYTLDLSG